MLLVIPYMYQVLILLDNYKIYILYIFFILTKHNNILSIQCLCFTFLVLSFSDQCSSLFLSKLNTRLGDAFLAIKCLPFLCMLFEQLSFVFKLQLLLIKGLLIKATKLLITFVQLNQHCVLFGLNVKLINIYIFIFSYSTTFFFQITFTRDICVGFHVL